MRDRTTQYKVEIVVALNAVDRSSTTRTIDAIAVCSYCVLASCCILYVKPLDIARVSIVVSDQLPLRVGQFQRLPAGSCIVSSSKLLVYCNGRVMAVAAGAPSDSARFSAATWLVACTPGRAGPFLLR